MLPAPRAATAMGTTTMAIRQASSGLGTSHAGEASPEVAFPEQEDLVNCARSRRENAAARGDTAVALPTLARLMIWLSPAFPVGGFSYSHGLEWVVEAGDVRDACSLAAWIEDVLAHGSGRSDVIFLAATWRAVVAGDGARLRDATELAGAFVASAERRLETLAQGTAFLTAVEAVWPHPMLTTLSRGGAQTAFPAAVGACAAAHGLALRPTAQAFCQAFCANLVSAGVRLIPLGQTDGLRVQARLEAAIPPLIAEALDAGLDDVGGAALAADIASMRHETQYTRLFRS